MNVFTPAPGVPYSMETRVKVNSNTVIGQSNVISEFVSPDFLTPDERERRHGLHDALLLESAGPRLWRLCDARIVEGPDRLLALIEATGGEFEVMQSADHLIWSMFPTMRVALAHVVDTHPVVLASRPRVRHHGP